MVCLCGPSCRNLNAGRLSAISNRSLPLESLHSDRGEYSQVVKYPKALTTPESSRPLVSRRQPLPWDYLLLARDPGVIQGDVDWPARGEGAD